MDEYIKREEVLKIIADNCPHDKCGDNTEEEIGAGWACCYIMKGVENIPTADVAPRAEVAREIFEEMDKIMLPLLHEVSQVYIYVKLKKKYTQPDPPKGD